MRITFLFILFSNMATFASEYDEKNFKDDLFSPAKYDESKSILLWGSSLTLGLILNRNTFSDKLQEDMAKEEPMGELADFGDIMGQMVPNFSYIIYQWRFGEENLKHERMSKMFKATIFSGGTTFFLKRLINQRRPHKGDRNSFPSGHTTTAFAFASVISLEHEKWTLPAYTMATIVGLSRMNDNAHYLHDVTMGATIGMAYGYGIYNMSKKTKNKNIVILPTPNGMIANYYF